jgi:DNA polymerase I-like protein with 3'-5' exonuclease and polymerase domains
MELHIVDSAFTFKTFEMHVASVGAIDIETTIGNPWKEGEVEIVSVAVTYDGWRAWVFANDIYLEQARNLLSTTDWIMHNGLFDRLIMKTKGFDTPLKHDTMAMQYLLDPDGQGRGIRPPTKPNALETVSKYWLNLTDYKDVDYKNILDEPFEKVAEMNGEDVCRTFNLYRPLADELNKDKQLSRIYQWLLMPAVNELIEVTLAGVPLDQARLTALTESFSEEVGHLLDKLRAATPDPDPETYGKDEWKGRKRKADPPPPFNPGSPEQVVHVLFDLWKLPILEYTKDTKTGEPTDRPSTNKDVLLRLEVEHLTGEQEAWVAMLRQYREKSKLLSSYLNSWPGLIGDDRRLHPRYKPLHVVTGRLSSDQPNIQNVPRKKEFRAMFGGEPGYTWLKADYSQIELRIAAWLAQEPSMLNAYENGDDLHALTAQLILGVDDVTREVKAGTTARDVGKILNFGLLYGAGPTTLRYIARTNYDVFFDHDEAVRHRENFFYGYPALERWHRTMRKSLEWTGQVRSPLGRIRYLPKAKIPWDVEDMRGQKIHAILEGTNHPVQSMASDLLLMSLVRVAPLVRPLGVEVVAEVHDEIDFLCPDDRVDEASEIIKTTMEDVSWLSRFGIKLGVPVVADIETGPYWGEVS